LKSSSLSRRKIPQFSINNFFFCWVCQNTKNKNNKLWSFNIPYKLYYYYSKVNTILLKFGIVFISFSIFGYFFRLCMLTETNLNYSTAWEIILSKSIIIHWRVTFWVNEKHIDHLIVEGRGKSRDKKIV
jgi:hypothetical protein